MPVIGLIDDRKDLRETLRRQIQIALPDKWKCISSEPLPEIVNYSSWINKNNIAVLILDERLNEQTPNAKPNVGYYGHDIVDFIRKRSPAIPIYIISNYVNDEAIIRRFSAVEEIISRTDFTNQKMEYVQRMIRSAQKYVDTYQDELSSLSRLSKLVARGTANRKDIKRMEALREKLYLAFPSIEFQKSAALVSEMNETLKSIKTLRQNINRHLKKSKK